MYKNINEVTLKSLKDHVTEIHYFGLGFIQIKLDNDYRMHFYTEKLPAITGDEDIHNHRYDFTSYIFFGELFQEIFLITEGDSHILEAESCKEGVEANIEPKRCGVKKLMAQNFSVGSNYFISHEAFHKVKTSRAITLLKRGSIAKEFADVTRPIGAPIICPFSKKIPEAELWDIVDDMLKDAHGN